MDVHGQERELAHRIIMVRIRRGLSYPFPFLADRIAGNILPVTVRAYLYAYLIHKCLPGPWTAILCLDAGAAGEILVS